MTQSALRWLGKNRAHLIFGSNTDVGKTIVTTALVQASLRRKSSDEQVYQLVKYIKPLQCGGSDQSFVDSHVAQQRHSQSVIYDSHMLYQWKSYTSPHLASRFEDHYVSDDEVLSSLLQNFQDTLDNTDASCTTFIETAGGVLSPGPANSNNKWSTQADLYSSLNPYIPTILVGDGSLGGISATISSLESIWMRGYNVDSIILLETNPSEGNDDDDTGKTTSLSNTEALQEYIFYSAESSIAFQQKEKYIQTSSKKPAHHIQEIPNTLDPEKDIICITKSIPPMPLPLTQWFQDSYVISEFDEIESRLEDKWFPSTSNPYK